MAKTEKKPKAKSESAKAKKESTVEAVVEEIPSKIVEPTIEAISEAKSDVKEEQAEVSATIVPTIEVKELKSYKPDTIDEFAVFTKAKGKGKKDSGGMVWVKDHSLLRKVEGRQFTLSGTEYFGELRDNK